MKQSTINILSCSVFILLFLLLIGGCALLVRCGEKATAVIEDHSSIGKYVYIDRAGVLHTKQGCSAVYKEHEMQEVRPVELSLLVEKRLEKVCSQCVSESQLIHLHHIADANHTEERMELYDNLLRSGLVTSDEIGSREQFISSIKDEASARQFYRSLINSGLFTTKELGSEDEFYRSISPDFPEE